MGLSPEATAELVGQLVEAGIDFIKDDELQADGPHCPFSQRVQAVMRVVNNHAQRTGKKVMMAFNLTGEISEMLRRQELVLKAGGTCVMVSLNSAGLPGVSELRRHSALPIHAHRNGWGLFQRSPHIGIGYLAYQNVWHGPGSRRVRETGPLDPENMARTAEAKRDAGVAG